MKILIFLLIMLAIVSCNSKSYNCPASKNVIAFNDSIENDPFFKKEIRRMHHYANVKDLRISDRKSVRLTVFYSWDIVHSSYTYEKLENGGKFKTVIVYTEGYKKSTKQRDVFKIDRLTEKECIAFERVIERNCLWSLPIKNGKRGLDGNTYFIEVYDPDCENYLGKDFVFLYRWSPDENSEFGKICQFIESFRKKK